MTMGLFDMGGKVAVITGSSRGIGKAIAEAMAEAGAKIVISSRNQGACDEVAAMLNGRHGEGTAVAVAASLSNREQLERLVYTGEKTFGRIDVLVCNAASNPYFGSMSGISDEQFTKILANNVVANNWLVSLVTPGMIERKDGAIIIVSSIGGLRGSPTIGAYNVSKAADFQLARNLAVEHGRHNIRVNCIAPGLIRTDFARALWEDPKQLELINRTNPMGRIGEPEEIAGAAVFLASKAGSYVTGQAIVVDGGTTV